MLTRPRTTGLALSAAMLLALAVAGTTLGATVLVGGDSVDTDPSTPDTALTWEDLDGDGIDDDCDAQVVADPATAAASDAAADTDGDGRISVDEAARTDRIGGPECNHGGYVSAVAAALGEDEEGPDEDEDGEDGSEDEPAEPCDEAALPAFDPVVFSGPAAFGAYVSSIAASDVSGGTHCNHGGAVSAAVAAAKDAARAAREAERALDAADREAAKAERDAAKAERAAAKAKAAEERASGKDKASEKSDSGKGKGKGQASRGNGKGKSGA